MAVAPDGITINLVAPGRIETDRVRTLDVHTAQREGISKVNVRAPSTSAIPAGHYGRPGELGAAVDFLASESASYEIGRSMVVMAP